MTFNPQVLTDVRIYFDSADLTGYSNKVEWDSTCDDLDKTTFASAGSRERVGGLFDTTVSSTVFWQAGDLTQPDDLGFADLGDPTAPLTVVPTSGAVASVAYLTQVLETQYQPSGSIGQLLTADMTWMGDLPVARGQIMHPQGTARTSTGTGTAVQLGAVLSTQRMYANLHVLSVSGTTPSLTVKLQSSATSGGTYVDRMTFTAATGVTGQAMSLLGAVTDTWWKAIWTISGTSPSFLFAVSAGVASK